MTTAPIRANAEMPYSYSRSECVTNSIPRADEIVERVMSQRMVGIRQEDLLTLVHGSPHRT